MSHKLLLADDSVTIQRVIELTFADEDVQVIAVGDGQQAMERIEQDRPDIVLADIGMPGRDGYEVAAFVKSMPHLRHIPVLLLTGAFEPVDEERAQAVGCDGVLAKPFEPQMVITRVKELLADAPGRMPDADRLGDLMLPAVAASGEAVPGDAPAAPLDLNLVQTVDPGGAGDLPAAPPTAVDESGPEAEVAETQAADGGVRIHRRAPVAVPEKAVSDAGGAGAVPSAAGANALDDYFDRLDAAFATLAQAPAGGDASAAPSIPLTAAEILRAANLDLPGQPDATQTSRGGAAEIADAALHPGVPPAPVAQDARGETGRPPVLARAFSALLAAERGDEGAGEVPSLWGQPAIPPELMDELATRVTGMVLERMTDRVVRETVADIVSRVTERLVREEIDRVKATIK